MNVGRPSKDIEKRVTVGINKDTYEKISYLSKREGVSISEYIRKIIKRNIK